MVVGGQAQSLRQNGGMSIAIGSRVRSLHLRCVLQLRQMHTCEGARQHDGHEDRCLRISLPLGMEMQQAATAAAFQRADYHRVTDAAAMACRRYAATTMHGGCCR
jgi:hypothetical protein